MKQSEAYELQYLQARVGVRLGWAKSICPDAAPTFKKGHARVLALGASPSNTPTIERRPKVKANPTIGILPRPFHTTRHTFITVGV